MKRALAVALCLIAAGLTGCGAEPKSFRPAAPPPEAPAPRQAADLLDGIDPAAVTGVLDLLGHEYRVGYDNYGAPLIGILPDNAVGSREMYVLFNACDAANVCEDITLVSWDLERGPIHLELIDRWNRDNRFLRAFIDPDYGPVLQMDINSGGGLGPDSLTRQISVFFAALDRFAATLDVV